MARVKGAMMTRKHRDVYKRQINKSLDLEETDGWRECESCGEVTQQMKYVKTRKVPCYQMGKVQVLVPLPQK